ncbi:MAG TPA: DNA polymerase IV, partial [Tissierellaceae bacterium]|nr:DNA polymerase IV [Tissierellaceae bacterium]
MSADIDKREKLNILHIDMDAFYAAVEEQDNPSLIGRPVIVGGTKRHGIVTTANYEARKYGIHSAMPIYLAKAKCPHGYYLPTRMERYREVSNEVFETLYEITDQIEPVSVDEAYLDIENLGQDPVRVAKEIKRRVLKK